MEDILFHMLFVVPLTRWITNADRPWNKKTTRNGAFIALAALFVIGLTQSTRSSLNHFEIIGVPSGAPAKVVASAYRKLSLQYHPDKNPSMEAKEIFASIRELYGIYLCICFSSELLLRTGTADGSRVFNFLPYVGSLLPFERVVLLRAWAPLTLNALLLIGDEFAEDDQNEIQEDFARHLLKSSLENIKALGECLLLMEKAMIKSGRLPVEVRWGEGDGPRLLQLTPLANVSKEVVTSEGSSCAPLVGASSASPLPWKDSFFFEEMSRRAREKAAVTAAMEKLGFRMREGVDAKQLESERRRLLQESGFTERTDVQTPWALEALPPGSPDLRDQWMEVLKKEMATWKPRLYGHLRVAPQPRGLVVDNLLSREECQSYEWRNQRKKLVEVLEQSNENERGGGFSLGTFLFFFMLFIRWYTS